MKLEESVYGSALGPDWSFNIPIKGASEVIYKNFITVLKHWEKHWIFKSTRQVTIEYNCEIKRVLYRKEYLAEFPDSTEGDFPVYVELKNNKILGCDLVVSATGVVPAVDLFTRDNNFDIASDGGLKVNDKMETSIKDVYVVGDACTASWDLAPHWFQMRLWSQACQMADYAARSMWASFTNQDIQLDFCFELFAHITNFFNFKIILLGNYDARGLGNDYELLLRCTDGVEYVKIVVYKGKVQGALLIGETDLEETFENLILNQIDVSPFGENLINPDIDIEDYFD